MKWSKFKELVDRAIMREAWGDPDIEYITTIINPKSVLLYCFKGKIKIQGLPKPGHK